MNERIRELYRQAHSIRYHDSDPSRAGNPPTVYWQGEVSAQRFAELIIRECMKESWDEIVSDEDIAQERDPLIREYLKGNNQGIVDVVIKFRNHFGVEE
jgi:hypothetical protein